MDLDTYRKIGRNAAKYVKGEKVTDRVYQRSNGTCKISGKSSSSSYY